VAENAERPKTLVAESDRLVVFTRCPTAPEKFSVLKWGIWDNKNPRLIVFTGDPEDRTPEKNYGRITAAMDPVTAGVFCDLLENVANGNFPREVQVPCFNTKRDAEGIIVQKKALISTIHIGRDDDGIVYIRVTAEGRPDVKFPLMLSDWHGLCGAGGEPFEKHDISKIYATAYARQLRIIFALCLKETFTTERKGQRQQETRPAAKPAPEQKSTIGNEISFDEDITF
jgi:hypothetical protein